jgi:hypothetical protein
MADKVEMACIIAVIMVKNHETISPLFLQQRGQALHP